MGVKVVCEGPCLFESRLFQISVAHDNVGRAYFAKGHTVELVVDIVRLFGSVDSHNGFSLASIEHNVATNGGASLALFEVRRCRSGFGYSIEVDVSKGRGGEVGQGMKDNSGYLLGSNESVALAVVDVCPDIMHHRPTVPDIGKDYQYEEQ